MAMFWVGALVTWRLYTMSMVEMEERMVQEMKARMKQERVEKAKKEERMVQELKATMEQEKIDKFKKEERMVQELKAKMEQEKVDQFWLGLAMTLLITVGVVVKSFRTKMQEREEIHERLLCVVCLEAKREVILLDCGHVCSCRKCADILWLEEQLCPVCRAEIRTIKTAFIS